MAKKISLLPKAREARIKIEVKKTLTLVISLIIIAFFIFFWFILLGYSQSHQNSLKNIENKISVLETEIESLGDISSQAQIVEAKLSGIELLFKNRIYWSEFSEELEKLTLKRVSYDGLVANTSTSKMTLSGIAENYRELARLIFSLTSSPKIDSVGLNSAKWQSKEGVVGVKFNIVITLTKDALIK